MDQRIIDLYDAYTHSVIDRRSFLNRLATLAGGVAAASALLPLLANNYAYAAQVAPDDPRLSVGKSAFVTPRGPVFTYEATPKRANAITPIVLVIHENRGLNPHIEDVVRRLAVQGFRAAAPDLLSHLGGTPADEDKARDMIATLKQGEVLADCDSAVLHYAGPKRVGAVGFCWGGGIVDRMAAAAHCPDAVVSYYGMPPDADTAANIKCPLLLHYAGLDQRTNAAFPAFQRAMYDSGVTYQAYTYKNVQHAFNNDTNPARYNAAAASLAWERTLDFLRRTLGDPRAA